MILRRRGLTSRVTPPVSLVLATFSKDYIAGLTATHYEGEPFSPEAISGTDKSLNLCCRVPPIRQGRQSL